MAKTEVIAAAFKISPPTLQKWLDGDKPTRGKYVSVCQEIFTKFDYIDGEWFPKDEPKQKPEASEPLDVVKEKVETPKVKKDNKSPAPDATIETPQIVTNSLTKNSEIAVKDKQDRPLPSDTISNTSDLQAETTSEETKEEIEQEKENYASEPTAIFSAVGIIVGEINLEESGNYSISLGNKTYPLFYARKNYTAFTGLKKEIATTGNKTQRLIVYPKFTHFPRRDQAPRVGFQLVGFDKGREPNGVANELKELEFKLCGLWQFIPVCRQPCISIFRNFSSDRLDYIKQAEAQSKVNFMKASHLPLLWRDSPVPPFRFNPKAGKEQQGKTFFVQIKAVFLPHRDCFGFVEQLAEPMEKPPKFLKASKKDKAAVQQSKPRNQSYSNDRVKPTQKPSSKVINKEKTKSLPKLKKIIK